MKEYCLNNALSKLFLNYTKDKPQIIEILNHLNQLKYEDRPNYKLIRSKLSEIKFNEFKNIPISKLETTLLHDLIKNKFKLCMNQGQGLSVNEEANKIQGASPFTNSYNDLSDLNTPINNQAAQSSHNQIKFGNHSTKPSLFNRIKMDSDNFTDHIQSLENAVNLLVKKKRKREEMSIQNDINVNFPRIKQDCNARQMKQLDIVKNSNLSDLEKQLLNYLISKQSTESGNIAQKEQVPNVIASKEQQTNLKINKHQIDRDAMIKIMKNQLKTGNENQVQNDFNQNAITPPHNLTDMIQKMNEIRLMTQLPLNFYNNMNTCNNINIAPNFMFGNIYYNPTSLQPTGDSMNMVTMQRFADMIYSINTLSNQISMQNRSLMETHKQNTNLYQQLLSNYMISHNTIPMKHDN